MKWICILALLILFSCSSKSDIDCTVPQTLPELMLNQAETNWKTADILYVLDTDQLDNNLRHVLQNLASDKLQIRSREYLFMRAIKNYVELGAVDCKNRKLRSIVHTKAGAEQFDIVLGN